MCLKIKEHIEMESSSLEEYMRQREPGTVGCKAFDDHWNRGVAEGMAEGMAEGKAEGIVEGMAKGMAKGMTKGMAEGKKEERARLVKLLSSKGFSAKDISSLIDIPEEEVCSLLPEPTAECKA